MKTRTVLITQAAVIAAAYIVLTLPFAQFAFGPIQLRLAEALTVLPILTPAAVPGLFIGCLLANTLNPAPLGLIDIVFGSLASLAAGWLTWRLGRRVRERNLPVASLPTLIALLPPILINGLVVGFYLPFILPDIDPSPAVIAVTMLSIAASQAVVIFAVGAPLLAGIRKTGVLRLGKD